MKLITTIKELKKYRQSLPRETSISFIPTMGALHEGHTSLIELARKKKGLVGVSIFVNPLQFNKEKDFDTYPRTLKEDLLILEEMNVNFVFAPSKQEVYGNTPVELKLVYPNLMNKLCGKYREVHFEGVLYIVYKLLKWIQPHTLILGSKDYQQCLLISKMTIDLELGINVVFAPTIREKSGLAISSRNTLLSKEGREKALLIYQALSKCVDTCKMELSTSVIILKDILEETLKNIKVEYMGVYNPLTLEDLPSESVLSSTEALIAIATYIDGVRLIDNMFIEHIV